MGGRRRPKSTTGVHAGESGNPEPGGSPLDKYGRGEKDPITGIYEWYEEVPAGLKRPGKPIDWDDIFDCWELVEADFASHYHIDLEGAFRTRSWRWFAAMIAGLLSEDTRLHRMFRDDPTEVTDGGGISDDGGFDRWQSED